MLSCPRCKQSYPPYECPKCRVPLIADEEYDFDSGGPYPQMDSKILKEPKVISFFSSDYVIKKLAKELAEKKNANQPINN